MKNNIYLQKSNFHLKKTAQKDDNLYSSDIDTNTNTRESRQNSNIVKNKKDSKKTHRCLNSPPNSDRTHLISNRNQNKKPNKIEHFVDNCDDLIESDNDKSIDKELVAKLASINLFRENKSNQISLKNNLNISSNSHLNLKLDEKKLDFNRSLVDQVLGINHITNNSFNNDHFDQYFNQPSVLNNIKFERLSVPDNPVHQESICINEILTKMGAQRVPVEYFHHVSSYYKQCKQFQSNNNNFLSKSPSSNQNQSNYLKFEYVYGEKYFWIVKIKRITDNLCMVKLMRNINFSNKDDDEQDEIVKNSLPPTPTSPASSVISSSSSSSDLTSSYLSPNTSRISSLNTKLNLNLFSTDTNSFQTELLLKHLRLQGWSKNHNRQTRKPSEIDLNDSSFIDCTSNNCSECLDQSSKLKDYFKQKLSTRSFHENCVCEFQDNHDSINVNIARVLRNKSGRLLIEYSKNNSKSNRVWLFSDDPRLHPLGWAKSNNFKYQKSELVNQLSLSDLNLNDSSENLKSKNEHELRQRFHLKKNHFLECLYKNKFYPAKVIETKAENCVKLQIDSDKLSESEKIQTYHSNFNTLFPCKWCLTNNIHLEKPSSWDINESFDWNIYIDKLKAFKPNSEFNLVNETSGLNWSKNLSQLAEKFQLGMYLECAVKQKDSEFVCLGQIKAKISHLIFVKLVKSGSEFLNNLFIYSVDSIDLFPVGWCEMNNYYEDKVSYTKNYEVPINEIQNLNYDFISRPDIDHKPYFKYFKSEFFIFERI